MTTTAAWVVWMILEHPYGARCHQLVAKGEDPEEGVDDPAKRVSSKKNPGHEGEHVNLQRDHGKGDDPRKNRCDRDE